MRLDYDIDSGDDYVLRSSNVDEATRVVVGIIRVCKDSLELFPNVRPSS